jgi:hypothetical protein
MQYRCLLVRRYVRWLLNTADREWYSSFYYQGVHCTLGADTSLICIRPIRNTRDDYCGLYLLRPLKERDFNGRQRAVAAEAMAMVALLIGVGTFRGYGTWRGRFRRKGLSGP